VRHLTIHLGCWLERAGHLAVWVGLYVAAAVLCLAQVSGITGHLLPALLCAQATAMSVYLHDRLKIRDAWLDPADNAAHPQRYAFLTRHARAYRLLGCVLAMVGLIAAWKVHPAAPVLVVLSHAGVLLYAGLPRRGGDTHRRRIKDLLLVKNIAVAASITALAIVLRVLSVDQDPWNGLVRDGLQLGIGSAFVFAIVLADAMLCDLDDEPADRAFGTRTLPVVLGRRWTWVAAIAITAFASIGLVLAGGGTRSTWLWAVLAVAGVIALLMARPRDMRDAVDLKLPVLALGVALFG
jgi:4-hydroxybenzoate polyprenyltransferase